MGLCSTRANLKSIARIRQKSPPDDLSQEKSANNNSIDSIISGATSLINKAGSMLKAGNNFISN